MTMTTHFEQPAQVWEWRGWRLTLELPRRRARGASTNGAAKRDPARAEAMYRLQAERDAARRDLQRQWGPTLLERPLLNG